MSKRSEVDADVVARAASERARAESVEGAAVVTGDETGTAVAAEGGEYGASECRISGWWVSESSQFSSKRPESGLVEAHSMNSDSN